MNRNSGKVLTVFLVIVALLLISLAAVSIFFFQKETEKRQQVEKVLGTTQEQLAQVDTTLQETKKQKTILEEKNQELSERIEDITADLELEKGLKEETKKENAALTEQLKESNEAQNQLRKQVAEELKTSEGKIKDLQNQLTAETASKSTLEQQLAAIQSQAQDFQTQKQDLENQIAQLKDGLAQAPTPAVAAAPVVEAVDTNKKIKELKAQLDSEKKEKAAIEKKLETAEKEKVKAQEKLANLEKEINKKGSASKDGKSSVSNEKVSKQLDDLQQRLDAEIQKKTELEEKVFVLEDQNADMESTITDLRDQIAEKSIAVKSTSQTPTPSKDKSFDIELDPIVVNPRGTNEALEPSDASVSAESLSAGKVLSVDRDVQFVIINLGVQDGVNVGQTMSIYHSNKYLGDVKITRVLPEMSAADFIPPLAAQDVQKDDQVVVKE